MNCYFSNLLGGIKKVQIVRNAVIVQNDKHVTGKMTQDSLLSFLHAPSIKSIYPFSSIIQIEGVANTDTNTLHSHSHLMVIWDLSITNWMPLDCRSKLERIHTDAGRT